MLKRIFINSKKVPVPVPVLTLAEALVWVERTLVPAGHTITRVALDDRVIAEHGPTPELAEMSLSSESRLEIQIDSPVELTVQTLDAMRNLASVIVSGLKPLAVDCWKSKHNAKPLELDSALGDLGLILDLLEHVAELIDPMHVEAAAVQGIGMLLQRDATALALAKGNSDWKACARLLLNRLEPQLKELVAETEVLQVRILTQNDPLVAPTGTTRTR